MDAIKLVPLEWISRRNLVQTVDSPVPQIREEIVKVVHVDVHTCSRWKFRGSRGSLLFSGFSVCAKAKA